MTIADFKQQVANAAHRSLSSLTGDNSQDMILAAMNDARRGAQRAHLFELNRTEDAYLSSSQAGANWMTGAKTTPGGATAVQLLRLDEVWNYTTNTAPSTHYVRTTRVPFNYSGVFKRELPPVDRVLVVQGDSQYYTIQDQFAYTVGATLFVPTVTSATIFKLVGIKFLADLAGSEDPDIFLTYFTDWFRYATIAALNNYLKDSERFPIDDLVMERLWKTVITLDGTIANQGESVNLD